MKKTAQLQNTIISIFLSGVIISPFFLINDIKKTEKNINGSEEAIETLQNWQPKEREAILSEDGSIIGFTRQISFPFTPYSQNPQNLKNALIAAEDHSFWTNPGIDAKSMLRASLTIFKNGKTEGASTITQQVAKIAFLNSNTSTWEKKKKQIILAIKMTRKITKKRVMEIYLNIIPWGHGLTGISEASSYYFNKKPENLSLEECALLAGMVQAPTFLDPEKHHNRAKKRRDHILDEMALLHMITRQDAQEAKNTPIQIKRGPSLPPDREHPTTISPYEWVDDLASKHRNLTQTTIIESHQKILTQEFSLGLMRFDLQKRGPHFVAQKSNCNEPMPDKNEEISRQFPDWTQPWRYCHKTFENYSGQTEKPTDESLSWTGKAIKSIPPFKDGDIVYGGKISPEMPFLIAQPTELNGSAIMANANTGEITAITGGLRWTPGAFNRAISAERQPGSSIKPFVYLSAIEHGWLKSDPVFDIPVTISNNGQIWEPKNDNGDVAGKIPLSQALAESRNLATVNLALSIGFPEATKHLISSGITNKETLPSSVLGTNETTTFRLAEAATSLASDGYIKKIHINKNEKTETKKETEQEFAEKTLEIMHETLEDYGTMSSQKEISRKLEKAGYKTGAKTGTTSNFTDAWTLAIAKPWVVVVHIGKDNPEKMGNNAFASELTAPIAMKILERSLTGKQKND